MNLTRASDGIKFHRADCRYADDANWHWKWADDKTWSEVWRAVHQNGLRQCLKCRPLDGAP